MRSYIYLLLSLYMSEICYGLVRDNSTGEAWDYVTVRDGAHMFWWLYSQPPSIPTNEGRPFLMWLQGGPGASSTGFGNLAEIGPLDEWLQSRSSSWVSLADLLFVDSPIGTGYSYIDGAGTYTSTESQIDEDLYNLMKGFFKAMPQYQTKPFYIFGVSYGGKMGANFGVRLQAGINSGDILCNLKGVVLGDSWISAIDAMSNWAPFLKEANLLDDRGFQQVSSMAAQTISAIEAGQFAQATELWKQTQNVIFQTTDEVNPYNILQHHAPNCNKQSTNQLMNGVIKNKLGIIPSNVIWDAHRSDVFASQSGEFMKPAIAEVGQLLSSGLKVTVFQGSLDLLCDTPGTDAWIKKLPWAGLSSFLSSPKTPLLVDGVQQGTVQKFQNFVYFTINAGHMVPVDNPGAALEMVRQIIS